METQNIKTQIATAKNASLFASLLFTFAFQSPAFAQSTSEPESSPFPSIEKQARTYSFDIDPKAKGRPGVGTLKFIEAKHFVQLEFEGSGLKKGEYQIIRTANCKSAQRKLSSSKPNAENSELYSFKTQYGDISTEGKLNFQKIEDLGLENNAVALVKVEKNQKILIACTQ